MSLQGPIVVVAEQPATALVNALGAAGAFPVVESRWADAPTAFVAVKPAAVVIAEPGPAPNESFARMLCLQLATAKGAIVPVIARVHAEKEAAIPIALALDAALPVGRLIARLKAALRVRALHATVLGRIELYTQQGGKLPTIPSRDVLEDATVLIAGRGPLYPALSVAVGERVKMVGALSVEAAAKHLNSHDVDGIVVGDGFSPRMVEAFLTVLGQETRFRDIPVAVVGDTDADCGDSLPNIDYVEGDPARLAARMMPLVRMHAFETRLKRTLFSLDTNGVYEPDTGLLTRDAFYRDLNRAVSEALDRSQALSVCRIAFDGPLEPRAGLDSARQMARLVRNIDFAAREDDGSLLIVFTMTDLRNAHVVARRIAAALRNSLSPVRPQGRITANVTLATLKAGDTVDSLMMRVTGGQVVAAE